MPKKIAIIGAGIAGVSLARLLGTRMPELDITIFEKSRGIGGRMATRRGETGEFDHGAQYFTVRTPEFKAFLDQYRTCFQAWEPRVSTLAPGEKPYGRIWFEPHFVGLPRMNSLCKGIAGGPHPLNVQLEKQVEGTSGEPGARYLDFSDASIGPFDWVVSTAPAPQAENILNIDLSGVGYEPVFALMLPLTIVPAFDAAVVKNSLLEWLAVGNTKPERGAGATLLAHASGPWSARKLEVPATDVADEMIKALGELGVNIPDSAKPTLHRWRYARVTEPLNVPFLLDAEQRIAACGDWCMGARVEDAFNSAFQLSRHLTALLAAN